MLDACGPMCEYRGTLKKLGVLMHLFEELSRAHCGKEGKQMAAAVGCPLLWAVLWPLMPK